MKTYRAYEYITVVNVREFQVPDGVELSTDELEYLAWDAEVLEEVWPEILERDTPFDCILQIEELDEEGVEKVVFRREKHTDPWKEEKHGTCQS